MAQVAQDFCIVLYNKGTAVFIKSCILTLVMIMSLSRWQKLWLKDSTVTVSCENALINRTLIAVQTSNKTQERNVRVRNPS